MAKITKENETDNASMSNQMIMNCKNNISKFGFTGQEYIQFLISVCAMKDKDTVMKYPNDDLNEYRERFIKKNEYSIGDNFQLDKCKIKSSNDGKQYFTGYFCPRAFWDSVLTKSIQGVQ